MREWSQAPTVAVGGLIAVAFLDEHCIAVGSHSGLGVFEIGTGTRVERVDDTDGSYPWFQEDPPAIRWHSQDGVRLLPAAGLWGGEFPSRTEDGWSSQLSPGGVTLTHPDMPGTHLLDDEEHRAAGFSRGGSCFVLATSSAIHALTR